MKYGHIATFLFGTIFILGSCVKENLSPGSSVPDGEPATISLKVSTSDMDIVTRALTDEQLQQVNDIWIGVYNVKTGELTGSYSEDNSDNVAETNSKKVTIDAASGNSYIVAVANVKRNYGVTDNPTLEEDCRKNNVYLDEESGRYQLSGMLEHADTWEKFKSISAAWNTPGALDLVTPNSPMYGHYSDKGPDNNTAHDYEDIKPVTIKPGAENSLTGAIHLRSLYSYITFNVTAQNAAYEDFTFEPLSWQVFNVPTISYLYEGNKANSADLIVINDAVITDETGSYGTSKASTTFDYTNAAKKNSYTFDFYLFENKHTGTADTYEEREKEYKTGGLNTGIYKSLVSEEEYNLLDGRLGSVTDSITNNFATYVQLKAYITYTTKDDVPRAGYATYVIHLGYVGNDAADFNVHRHTKYTYNVTITDINSIVVEAQENGETRPDTEGDVTDATTAAFDLDAHFCVFNIKLSNKDRYDLNYRIRAPYGNDVVNLTTSRTYDEKFVEPTFANKDDKNYKFYSWIEFKPVATEDEHILAVYSAKDSVLRMDLEGLRETVETDNGRMLKIIHPLDESNGDIEDKTQYYYTVFVNEYVYEDEKGDETKGNWVNYVNKDNRAIWLILTETDISEDTESVYTNAAYLFNQKSIMTYYDLNNLTDRQTAVGVEQVNENYGLNMIWTFKDTPSYTENNQTYNNGWSSTNGRWNVMEYMTQIRNNHLFDGAPGWQYYANTTANQMDITVKYYDDENVLQQEDKTVYYINQMYVPEINNTKLSESRPETYPALYMPISVSTNTNISSTYLPNTTKSYYEIMEACLMRNRDENGNGKIDDKELKWYLPTSGKYVRILLGESGFPMSARLMNFSSVTSLPAGIGGDNWQYHYATSDQQFIWAEEGMASASISANSSVPWQLRCIRNLGTNLSEHIKTYDMTEVVEYAYQHDTTNNNHTIKPTYYNSNVKRQPVASSLVVHKINDEENLLGMYGFEYSTTDLKLSATDMRNWVSNSQTKCDELNNDTERPWRVPNQKELTIMRREILKDSKLSGTPMWCSCTTEYFGNSTDPYGGNEAIQTYNDGSYHRFMKITTSGTTAGSVATDYYVRCVRDLAN